MKFYGIACAFRGALPVTAGTWRYLSVFVGRQVDRQNRQKLFFDGICRYSLGDSDSDF